MFLQSSGYHVDSVLKFGQVGKRTELDILYGAGPGNEKSHRDTGYAIIQCGRRTIQKNGETIAVRLHERLQNLGGFAGVDGQKNYAIGLRDFPGVYLLD